METRKCRILLPASEPVAYRLVSVLVCLFVEFYSRCVGDYSNSCEFLLNFLKA